MREADYIFGTGRRGGVVGKTHMYPRSATSDSISFASTRFFLPADPESAAVKAFGDVVLR